MSMHDDHDWPDELDRALLALPLEEPPAGLRTSILMATAYRPTPAFSFWEVTSVGVLGAVGVWLLVLLALGGGQLFLHTLATIGAWAMQALSNWTVVVWLAAGGATALWLTLFTGSQPIALEANRSAGRDGR
jgi:hypothetical protein